MSKNEIELLFLKEFVLCMFFYLIRQSAGKIMRWKISNKENEDLKLGTFLKCGTLKM